MSLYILMRLLESAPQRYDLGIRLLTFGQLNRVYSRLTHYLNEGDLVLDVGCGTGSLSLHAARRGARVKGIDIDPRMLEIAKERARREGMADVIEFIEMGVAELDTETTENYDVVVSGLCFSELSADEIAFTLTQAKRILRPGDSCY